MPWPQSTPEIQARRGKRSPPLKNFGAKQIEICLNCNKFTNN
jgi:hypothetical protein